MTAGNLPEDLIIDFLLRVPVKSLIRFMCVHKTWKSLFTSSYFATTHLQNPNKESDGSFILLVPYFDSSKTLFRFRILAPETFDVIAPDYELPLTRIFHVFGSCNGLACLASRDYSDVVLCNPSLKQHNILPESNLCLPNEELKLFGFGYDSTNNDYKVLRQRSSKEAGRRLTELFSLKTNCWREVESLLIPDGIDVKVRVEDQCFFNGAIHRLALDHSSSTEDFSTPIVKLISFDVCKEKFKLFLLPNRFQRKHYNPPNWNINVYGDLLCIVEEVIHRWEIASKYYIWAMKEYGVEGSWVKLHSIRLNLDDQIRGIVGFGMNGELILFKEFGLDGELIFFKYQSEKEMNYAHNQRFKITLRFKNHQSMSSILPCMNSLVSPSLHEGN